MGQLLPLDFCLLTRKTRLIYREMVASNRDQATKLDICLSLSHFRVDFENAFVKRFKDVFPDKNFVCFFLSSAAHWRKTCDLGLRTQYVEDETFAMNFNHHDRQGDEVSYSTSCFSTNRRAPEKATAVMTAYVKQIAYYLV